MIYAQALADSVIRDRAGTRYAIKWIGYTGCPPLRIFCLHGEAVVTSCGSRETLALTEIMFNIC